MAIKKNITIDGIEVPFKASAAVPRLYRLKFHRDIYKDFASLKTDVAEGDENKSELDIESLEVFVICELYLVDEVYNFCEVCHVVPSVLYCILDAAVKVDCEHAL